MKKVLLFLAGIVVGIFVLGGIAYWYLNTKMVTITMDESTNILPMESSDFETEIKEVTAEDFLQIRKKINKPTMINFWASWCKPCVEEIPYLKRYAQKNNMDLIFVSSDKNNEKQKDLMSKQMNRLRMPVSYIIKESSSTVDVQNYMALKKFVKNIGADETKVHGFGFCVILDENGEIVNEFLGFDISTAFDNYFDKQIKK
jgi:thiol-disulfide isomerase/thioredoxin